MSRVPCRPMNSTMDTRSGYPTISSYSADTIQPFSSSDNMYANSLFIVSISSKPSVLASIKCSDFSTNSTEIGSSSFTLIKTGNRFQGLVCPPRYLAATKLYDRILFSSHFERAAMISYFNWLYLDFHSLRKFSSAIVGVAGGEVLGEPSPAFCGASSPPTRDSEQLAKTRQQKLQRRNRFRHVLIETT